MGIELIIIGGLAVALVFALVVIWQRSKPITDQGLSHNLEIIAQSMQRVQSEQRASQEVQRTLKDELRHTADHLKNLTVASEEREQRDQTYFKNLLEASKNIESVMRGSKTKGMAGENIVREILKIFPQGTMVYDFKIGSKVVEFGLKLPDGRILPIDSKIMASDELQELATSDNEDAKLKIIQKLELAVLRKAREVGEYISPPVTYERAIMAVPDSLHYLLKESIIKAHRDYGVLIISYSMTIPYILSFMDLQRKHSTHLDEERVKTFLESLNLSLSKMDDILDNKVAKGNVMISNAYGEYKQIVSKIRGDALGLRAVEEAAKLEQPK
ncbi:MAG: DNA recombination protein RmuC [Patescibacteria group bacterium]|jgi:DNA recombination protein RmuC